MSVKRRGARGRRGVRTLPSQNQPTSAGVEPGQTDGHTGRPAFGGFFTLTVLWNSVSCSHRLHPGSGSNDWVFWCAPSTTNNVLSPPPNHRSESWRPDFSSGSSHVLYKEPTSDLGASGSVYSEWRQAEVYKVNKQTDNSQVNLKLCFMFNDPQGGQRVSCPPDLDLPVELRPL